MHLTNDNGTIKSLSEPHIINNYFIGDVLGSVGVHEGVPALLPVHVRGADVGDHHGVAVAVQGVLQQPGGNIESLKITQFIRSQQMDRKRWCKVRGFNC